MTVSETRRRIVKATRALHEEVGPAATTVSAIAERAGVQRLTVYRHFPDNAALLRACSSDWAEDHPLPDSAQWLGLEDPRERLETSLILLYGYFRKGAPMLASVLRDEAEVQELAEVLVPWRQYMREVAGGLSAGWGSGVGQQRLLRAAVGHALRFHTWYSLTEEGLSDEQAVELMAELVRAAAGLEKETSATDEARSDS